MNDKMMNEIYNMILDASHKMYYLWLSEIVFSWRWWINVALTIIPWIVWIYKRDKEKSRVLLFLGLIVIIMTNCLNNIGLSYHLWHYDYKIFPDVLMFVPWDYSLFPVGIMFMLQIKPEISAFIKAILFASLTAFIIEPFYSWIGLYQPVHWKYWYSFIIYISLYLIWNKIYNSKFLNT